MLQRSEEIKGILVPSTEVNVAEGQNERSVKGAFANGNETVIYDHEVKDSIESEMLKCVRCLWRQRNFIGGGFIGQRIFEGE